MGGRWVAPCSASLHPSIQAAKRALVARQAAAAQRRGAELDPSIQLGRTALNLQNDDSDDTARMCLGGSHQEVLDGLKRLARGASGERRVAGVPALSGILEPLGFRSSVRSRPAIPLPKPPSRISKPPTHQITRRVVVAVPATLGLPTAGSPRHLAKGD